MSNFHKQFYKWNSMTVGGFLQDYVQKHESTSLNFVTMAAKKLWRAAVWISLT